MTIRLHRGDLPDLARYRGAVAIDTETMGLDPRRDRLCVVQLSPGDGSADVVQLAREIGPAPNLTRLLADPSKTKIFHFADRKSTRLNSSHRSLSRMPSSA